MPQEFRMGFRHIPGRPAAWPAGSAAGCLAPCWVARAPGFCDPKLSGRQGPQPPGYLGARVFAGLLALPAALSRLAHYRAGGSGWLAPPGAIWRRLAPAALSRQQNAGHLTDCFGDRLLCRSGPGLAPCRWLPDNSRNAEDGRGTFPSHDKRKRSSPMRRRTFPSPATRRASHVPKK